MGKVVRMRLRNKPVEQENAPKKKKVERRKLNLHNMMMAVARARQKEVPRVMVNPFRLPQFPPSSTPKKDTGMALDDVFGDNNGNDWSWAGSAFLNAVGSVYQEGLVFPGYTYLAELAQRAEYRVIAETIAEESTRKWIKVTSNDDEDDKTERVKELGDALDKLNVRDCFRKASELDNLFGRAHLYVDIRDPATDEGKNTTVIDRAELQTPIGNGKDDISKSKIGKGFFKRLKAVEPVWTYPTNYNASDPLTTDWYEPDMWYVMGKQIHKTRLLKFVSREVPDMLKPAYAFGGLSMSQLAKPYIDNWLRIRQSVADIIQAFSIFVLSTDMSEVMSESSDALFHRIDLFNALRNNKGLMVLNKDTEEFLNVAAPLGTLDSLQAQSQEHMAAVSRIPLVKLLGIQPAGLNASSEGEIRTFYDHIHAYQERFFRPNLTVIIDMTMLSLWGEVDDTINFEFVKLWELDEAAEATKRKTDADTDIELIQAGVISPEEARKRIANDPNTPYQSLDVHDLPEPPDQGMEGGEGGPEDPDGNGGGQEGQENVEEEGTQGGGPPASARPPERSADGSRRRGFRDMGSGVENVEEDPAELDEHAPLEGEEGEEGEFAWPPEEYVDEGWEEEGDDYLPEPSMEEDFEDTHQPEAETEPHAGLRGEYERQRVPGGTASTESDTGWEGQAYMEDPTRGSNEAELRSRSRYNNGQGRNRPKFYTNEYNALVNLNEEDDKRVASLRDRGYMAPRERRARPAIDENTSSLQRAKGETGDPGGARGSFVKGTMPMGWPKKKSIPRRKLNLDEFEEGKHPRDQVGKFSKTVTSGNRSPLETKAEQRGRTGRPLRRKKLPIGTESHIMKRAEERLTEGPRVVGSKQEQEATLRKNWEEYGPERDYDFDNFKTWDKEAEIWNKEHPGNPIPENYVFGSNREFEEFFDKKHLEGKKKPYPGAKKANEYFSDDPETWKYTAFTSARQMRNANEEMVPREKIQ
jgi:phage-related protein (TIGR01555 family)